MLLQAMKVPDAGPGARLVVAERGPEPGRWAGGVPD